VTRLASVQGKTRHHLLVHPLGGRLEGLHQRIVENDHKDYQDAQDKYNKKLPCEMLPVSRANNDLARSTHANSPT
jgi:hypothetical protein